METNKQSSAPRVLVMANDLPDAAKSILAATLAVDYRPPDYNALVACIADYDGFWGNFDIKVDQAVLQRAARLSVINTSTTGTDHIDKEAAARRGIAVLSIAKDYQLLDTFTATAELAWLLLLSCMRNFRAANRAAHAGDWQKGSARFRGRQLSKKTLGVVGLGRLGKMVAAYGQGFRMRVLAHDPDPTVSYPGVTMVSFAELLAASDAISLHLHLTPATKHLFNASALAQMKSGAVLINTSRGDIVDEEALLAALTRGHIGAYGADVVNNEWRADMTEQALVRYALTHDNVVLTPHIGGATAESAHDARIFSAHKLVDFFQQKQL